MSSDDVLAEASQEIIKGLRAGMQVAEFLSRRRRQDLARAERRSVEDERRVRQFMEGERRLAAPVYRSALDEGWWETATVEQAARVYSVAGRFAQLDPDASRAVAECERQVQARWNLDLSGPGQALTSQDVDPKVLAAAAPSIPGEERENWGQRLDEAAQAPGLDAAAGGLAATDRSVLGLETSSQAVEAAAPTSSVDTLEAERQMAWQWAQQHYNVEDIWPLLLDGERQNAAHMLYSMMAAEGHDMDNPPAFDNLSQDVPKELKAAAAEGAQADFAKATGIRPGDLDRLSDHREQKNRRRIWAADQAGRYPDPKAIQWSIAMKSCEAVHSVNEVRLADTPDRAGTYTELAKRAAADEAARAGMKPEEYLDHLNIHQRRMLISTQGKMDDYYGERMQHAADYRVAYARAAAQARTEREAAGEQRLAAHADHKAVQGSGQEHSQDAATTSPGAGANGTGSRQARSEQTAATGLARDQASVARARTNLEAGEAREALYASGGAPTTTTSREQADVSRAQADETAWDSQAAREAWAQQQLDAGTAPEAVRAAVTGQKALHEPASHATRAPSKPRPRGRSQGARQNRVRSQQRHQ